MSMVRFATICDHCGTRSEEYCAFPSCRECQDDICHSCEVAGTRDDESGKTTCQRCADEERKERETAILKASCPEMVGLDDKDLDLLKDVLNG